MQVKHAIVTDKQGYKLELVLVNVIEEDGKPAEKPIHYTLKDGESLIYEDIPAALSMITPRWNGTAWEETGTLEITPEGVQKRMTSETHVRNSEKTEYMLSGLIRCDKCGSAFTGLYKTNNRGYKHRYYACSNKLNKKGCDCKNMNADDLETLIFITLKNEILNENIIERTADAIIATANEKEGTKKERQESIKKEIADLNFQIDNLLKAIMTGLDSISAREKLKELENRKVALEKASLVTHDTVTREIDRENLINQLKNDTFELLAKPERTKELVRKYVTKIIISDTTVEVTGISDIDGNMYSGNPQHSLEQLPEEERMIMTLMYREKLSLSKIGRAINMSKSAIYERRRKILCNISARI